MFWAFLHRFFDLKIEQLTLQPRNTSSITIPTFIPIYVCNAIFGSVEIYFFQFYWNDLSLYILARIMRALF